MLKSILRMPSIASLLYTDLVFLILKFNRKKAVK